jgi:group II intron reverse transcriptase/maturase
VLSDRTINALTGVSKATAKDGVRIKHLFRMMTHYPDLWMLAYENIHRNKGAITKGVNDNTLDGMGKARIAKIINSLKDEKYQPSPARRVFIPKKNGKKRPLGMPTGDDKLIQEVVRVLLAQIYEPVFSEHSHGFRTKRSCHNALNEIRYKWRGIKWVVDQDIKGFFDNVNHNKMISILEKKIDDKKFINLITLFLEAGYLENWKFNKTYSGTPQGGICSPILANIYLHELDQFLEKLADDFNQGDERKKNPEYMRAAKKAETQRNRLKDAKNYGGTFPWFQEELEKSANEATAYMHSIPHRDPYDPDFKRLRFVRYADDFVIGLIGSKDDAQQIMSKIKDFLADELELNVCEEKSGIRYIKKGFKFLGYHLSHNQERKVMRKRVRKLYGKTVSFQTRSVGTQIGFRVPKETVWNFLKNKGYLGKDMRPTHKNAMLHMTDHEIVLAYNAELRGFANYYALAARREVELLEWAGFHSLLKTLARKHNTRSQKLRNRMKRDSDHFLKVKVNGKWKEVKVFKLKHRTIPDPEWNMDSTPNLWAISSLRSGISDRLNAHTCEYCACTKGPFEIHHIKKLKDIIKKKTKQPWELRMISRQRKTMVLCLKCHDLLHAGKLPAWRRDYFKEVESRVQ